MSELRQTPFYRALHRPHLLWGGDRRLMIFALCISLGLPFTGVNMISAVAGLLIGAVSVYGLRKMAKADPLMWQVYIRQLQYQDYYAPFSRPWRVSKTRVY